MTLVTPEITPFHECQTGLTRLRQLRMTDMFDPKRPYPSRSLSRSATRSALAMIVSVGFTAPIEGKKLASVT